VLTLFLLPVLYEWVFAKSGGAQQGATGLDASPSTVQSSS